MTAHIRQVTARIRRIQAMSITRSTASSDSSINPWVRSHPRFFVSDEHPCDRTKRRQRGSQASTAAPTSARAQHFESNPVWGPASRLVCKPTWTVKGTACTHDDQTYPPGLRSGESQRRFAQCLHWHRGPSRCPSIAQASDTFSTAWRKIVILKTPISRRHPAWPAAPPRVSSDRRRTRPSARQVEPAGEIDEAAHENVGEAR